MYNCNVIKIFLIKNRKLILIALVVLFLVVLILAKTTNIFKNIETYGGSGQEDGLVYEDITIKDLVNKDTDGDGIPNWQEGLYGLDPTKKETTPGTPDSVALNKLKKDQSLNTEVLNNSKTSGQPEATTQTEQLSRELFATIAAASQNGAMDQATIDSLSTTLVDKIKNPVVRKTFTISNIKIISSNTSQTFSAYNDALNNIYEKHPMNNNVISILEKFLGDGENVNESALQELDPMIIQINQVLAELTKISVPQSASALHVNLLNAIERISENVSDIKLFNTDPIISAGAINKYQENANILKTTIDSLNETIRQKINN